MHTFESYDAYIDAHKERFLDELFHLLRVPSVAAQGRGITEAATLVRERLERLGASVRMISTDGGSPVVYATIGSGTRTLLIYDHYDVQPAEPLERWTNPPFEPTIRAGKIFARGVADNKGNLMLRIQAIENWLATHGDLPIRIVFVIEGEEEVSSRTLATFCRTYADLLQADGCLWETGGRSIDERPAIHCGVKGIQYVELVTRGAAYDLHSANATIVPNPAWRLTWALATLKDANERILIPGFYDHVRPPEPADLQALETIPTNDAALLNDYAIPTFLGGVQGIDMLRRHLFEPTCNICGLVSGYTGSGSKTVLPSEARVKIDFRLVPDMQPDRVLYQLRAHLDAQGYSDIEIIELGGDHPARSSLHAAVVQAIVASARTTYGMEPVVYPTMAGTGPMHTVCQASGTPATSGAGCGYHGAQIHAPDENVRLEDYWLAMRWMGRFIQAFASV